MGQDALDRDTPLDAVDVIVRQWHRERPGLDTSAKGVTGRVIRLGGLFQQAFAEAYEPLGLSETDFGILSPLRRAGEPYALTPTELARQRMLTSGGTTAAIDRVARMGLVTREPNPADRRGSLVRLTPRGLEAIDRAMEVHAEVEQGLVEALTPADRDRLAGLLRTLLLRLEDPADG
jgi:DNA-binding MarR family transcriptional regulator